MQNKSFLTWTLGIVSMMLASHATFATTDTDMQALARQALPGVRYRRHLLWRYSLVWTKPPGRSQAMTVPK